MNIQELFYGAWVYLLKNVGGQIVKEAHRVTGIMTSDKDAYIQTDDSDTYLPITAYEPIPLTSEILEENGFTGVEYISYCGNTYRLEVEDFRYIGLILSYENNVLRVEKINQLYPNSIGYVFTIPLIMYVHKLQHAFRLCGIDKEITLTQLQPYGKIRDTTKILPRWSRMGRMVY